MAGANAAGKSQLIALILCFFLGGLGIHRFYLGYTWQGVVQLLTLGGCGIWALIDFIRIIIGDLQPKNEDYETTL
ncbi:MAG: TM2 domain-containing protein [Chitinophagaceae bacterium]|nr:TM2 domain-containing protein [Chitinophagaceae bacterium]